MQQYKHLLVCTHNTKIMPIANTNHILTKHNYRYCITIDMSINQKVSKNI